MESNNNEDVRRLFFELSSTSRAKILKQLQENGLKLQEIARRLDMTVTETFRQLQRLNDAKLVHKTADGFYALTPLGRLALDLSLSMSFVSNYSDYFLEHDLSHLPREYINRIGELSMAEFVVDVPTTMDRVAVMVKEAQESIQIAALQVLDLHRPVMVERLLRGVKLKFIFQEEFLPLIKTVPGVEKNIERRYVPRIPAIIVVTDKEASISLPRLDGKMDYIGFFGKDLMSRKWVGDLFLHYWEKARPWYSSIKATV